MEDLHSSSLPLWEIMRLKIPDVKRHRREPTRPYKHTVRPVGEVRKQRPKAFEKLLGMTFAELEAEVHAPCCTRWKCNAWLKTLDVMEARSKTVSLSLSELYTWTVGQLETFQKGNGTFQYRHLTEEVCRTAWQRIHGVGDAILKKAHKLLANGNKVYAKSSSPNPVVSDLVCILLSEFFARDAEITSDGVWKLQDIAKDAGAQEYVKQNWKDAVRRVKGFGIDPDKPPSANTILKVWRQEFKHVKFIRGQTSCCSRFSL